MEEELRGLINFTAQAEITQIENVGNAFFGFRSKGNNC